MAGRMSKQLALFADLAVYLCVRLFFFVIRSLPITICWTLARAFAYIAAHVVGFRRQLIDENIQYAFPDWSPRKRLQIALGMWEHIFLMLVEFLHAPRKITKSTYSHYVKPSPEEERLFVELQERPTILLSGHMGNFEVAGYLSGLRGFSTHAISTPFRNAFLDRYFARIHAAQGQQIIPSRRVALQVGHLLETGQCVAMLADQHGGRRGIWIEFLGRPASYHKGPAIMSLTSGAPIVVAFTRRLDKPLHFETVVLGVFDPTNCDRSMRDARAITEWYNGLLEEMVRQCPDQYWWVHRRWKKPPERIQKAANSDSAAAVSEPDSELPEKRCA